MFQHFRYRHLPVLIAASAMICTGLWPLFGYPRAAVLEFGFPEHIANVPETWPLIKALNARHTLMGILMLIFYSRRQYDVLDTFLVLLSTYTVLVDCYVLWSEGARGWIVFRLVSPIPFLVVGWNGFTQGPFH